jgi:DNA (cytosine-5)-methyltransferase 1
VNELALFAGAGGGILGGKMLGWRTVCAVEWEPYPASVLCARQNDKVLETFPIWDDVQTFNGKPWRGIVDVISGGFPCQDISAAGKGEGIDGKRSGMWGEMARIIHEVQPRFVFVENSPMLTSRGLGKVLGDLATMGFDAQWGVLGAADVGANHQRDRIWIVAKQMGNAYNNGQIATEIRKSINEGSNNSKTWTQQTSESKGSSKQYAQMAYSCNEGLQRYRDKGINDKSIEQEGFTWSSVIGGCGNWWKTEPNVGRVADGVAARVDRLKAIGNGQVPLCAATAWMILSGQKNTGTNVK